MIDLHNSDSEQDVNDLVKLSFFKEIGTSITSATSVKETLQVVMEQIGKIFAPTYWSLLLRNSKTGELRFSVVVGSGVEELEGQVLPRGKGIAGWIAENGQPVIVEDVNRDKRFNPEIDKQIDFTTKSIIGVPLKSRNRVFGVIELINKIDGSSFTPLELSLLQTVADFAAIAIEKNYYLKALKHVASIDSLTGLYNRRSFYRFLEKEIARAKRSGESFALMMIDIDQFKQINDSMGHSAGDQVLLKIAELLKKTTRVSDIVCRFGGDEFLLLLPDSGLTNARALRQRIQSALDTYNTDTEGPRISVSFGIHSSNGDNIESAIDFVDKKMYHEKQSKLDPVNNERDIDNIAENTENLLQDL